MGCTCDAPDNPSDQQQPNGPRHGHQHVVHRHDHKRDQQDGPTAKAVRDIADQWSKEELHRGKDGGQDAAPKRCVANIAAVDLLDQVGHDGHDDADTHRIE